MSKSDIIIANFKAHAGVKDIVGRGLIYNDNVAIIELVKNSKDAGSPKVTIDFNYFISERSKVKDDSKIEIKESEIKYPEIIIRDVGKGMSLQDITDKWLNIAYSEKKNVTNKAYAGNKGVGRFSCDRLGKCLNIYTKSPEGNYFSINIDWTTFENKGKDEEISNIPIEIEPITKSEFISFIGDNDFESGTVLKITKLRSTWTEQKLKRLITELEKFSPSLDNGFEIFINSDTDFKDSVLSSKFNKKINNGILGKLSFKTIYIQSHIDVDGLFINTELFYHGEKIYAYKVKNPYANLSNISVEIHYLDSISKGFFTRNIGFSPNSYGSVFLFYNGFRISPYGNEKNDWLNLDQRKSQGTSRNLGTRDLFGKIDVVDHNDIFSVITSREGLAENGAFLDLVAFDPDEKTTLVNGKKEYGYASSIIRQLESFVVDGLDWNGLVDTLGEKKSVSFADAEKDSKRFILKELSKEKVEQSIAKIIPRSYGEVSPADFEINTTLISNIKTSNQSKYDAYIKEFNATLKNESIADLPPKKRKQVKELIETLQHERDIAQLEQKMAEDIADNATKDKIIATENLKLETKRSSLLEGMIDPEKTLDALITHVIQQISGGIEKDARSVLSIYYDDPDSISKEELIGVLERAVVDISTIKETASIATKANFNLKASSVKQDLFQFMNDYIDKIASKDGRWGINISFINENKAVLEAVFNPAEACVLFVNLIDNARKAGAKNFTIECSAKKIIFIDDGKGFDFERMKPSDYFKKGITTTIQGSGLGLYHCKVIASSLHASLTLESNCTQGAKIIMEF